MLDFIIFGIVDNGVMLLGAMTGLSVEKYLPRYFQNGIGTILGAGIANAMSDFMGGAVTANWPLAFGTFFGCILILVIVPIYEKFFHRKK